MGGRIAKYEVLMMAKKDARLPVVLGGKADLKLAIETLEKRG